MMRTLWDILTHDRPSRNKPHKVIRPRASVPVRRNRTPSLDRYEKMQREMLAEFGIRVRKWRSNTSGVAWQVTYADGSVSRLIESPKPRGPVSAAVFLHEVGHHAIGFGVYRPRCLEELHAWCFSLDQMEHWNLNVTDRVRKRVHESLVYAVDKAVRRGLKRIPVALLPYAASERDRSSSVWIDPRASEASGPS